MRRAGGVVGLALAVCLLVIAAPAQATLVRAGADGVLRITSETSVASGKGVSAVLLNHGGFPPTNTDTVFVNTGGPAGIPFEQVEMLNLDPTSEPWCRPQLSGPFVINVACDSAAIERIEISTGDGGDYVTALLARVGDHSTTDPSTNPAIEVSLGAGDDEWHGSALSEVVRDGLGSDRIYGYSLPASGNDLFIQPDTSLPALEDSGDWIDTDYARGVVSYAERSTQGIVTRNRDWLANDGAPGEHDDLHAFGVVGTPFDDELNGDLVHGGAGHDRIRGTGLEDAPTTLYGEEGDDELYGGEGADAIDGGGGADRIVSDIGFDDIGGGDGDDTIGADDGDPELVDCGPGQDVLTADPPATDAAVDDCEAVTRIVPIPVQTFVDHAPPPATNDTTPTVSFSSNYPTARFDCSVDGSPYMPCLSPLTSDVPLPDGSHTLLVRARRGTRVDETPAAIATRIDTVDPQTELVAAATAHDELDLDLGSNEDEVRYECSLDGGSWTACEDPLDVSRLSLGEHSLAVRSIDAATNVDASPETRTFTVVNTAPTLEPAASPATGSWDLEVALYLGAQDADGDDLTYRVNFGDGSIATGSEGTQPIRHTYVDAGVYVITATVGDGRAEATATETVTVTEPEPLDAAAGDDVVTLIGKPVTFDAGASRPTTGLGSVAWDFGDGHTATGARATHAYTTPGTYTATLTIRRRSEVDTDTRAVTVRAPEPTGLDVTVRGDGAPLADADVVVYDPQGRIYQAVSGPDGVARIGALADGEHRVLAYTPGFTPRSVGATTSNGSGTITVDLVSGDLASADLTSKRLTREEILDLGIDPDAPDNQVVYDFTLHIAGAPTLSGAATRGGFAGAGGGGGGGGGWGCDGDNCTSSPPGCSCTLIVRTRDGALTTLVVPARASMLKEFFDVRLLVSNLAPQEFSFSGGAATLALPSGLSLAPTSVAQQRTASLGSIPGGQSREAHWIVRGDSEGSYDLEAAFGAVLEPFGRPVGLTARTRSPLKVWGGSALRIRVETDDVLAAGHPYTVRVGLENVADVPLYDAAVSLAEGGAHGYIRQPRQRLSYRVSTLAPGETSWAGPFVLVPKDSGAVSLSDSFVKTLRGAGLPTAALSTRPRTPALGDTPQLRVMRRSDTSLTLDWDPVPGATDYSVFRTADRDTEFPDDPLAVTPVTSTRAIVTDAQFPQAGSTRQYALSARIGGVWTMVHPLAAEHLPTSEPSPAVDVDYADRCGQDGVLLDFDASSSDVELERWEWRPGNQGDWKPGGTLAGMRQSVTEMLPRPGPTVGSISVRVTDAIGGTATGFSILDECDHNDPRNVPAGVDEDTSWWEFPDTDGDGLPDQWEKHGVWVGTKKVDLAALGADPFHKDAFTYVDRVEGERWNDRIEGIVEDSFRNSPLAIRMHFIRAPRMLRRSEVPPDVQPTPAFFAVMDRLGYMDSGLGGARGSVPALAKYVCVCPDHIKGPGTAGEANALKGAHLVLTPNETVAIDALLDDWSDGQWPLGWKTSDEFIKDRFNASTLMHELGHLYGLLHHGAENGPPNDKNYKSIMSYYYVVFGVPRADGASTRYSIDFSRESFVNLDWRLGGDTGALSLVGGQHGENGDFYLQGAEYPAELEALADEPALQELLADPDIAESVLDGFEATAKEGLPRPSDPQAGTTDGTPTDDAGGGQATPAKVVIKVARKVKWRSLAKGLAVRVDGTRPRTAVTVTLLRAGRAVARRRVTSDHGGRTKVRLKLTNATLRKHRGARKFRVRVAFTDSLGRRRQTIVSVALKR